MGAVERFLFRPARPEPLAALRIAVCAIGLLQVVVLWPYLLQLYGNFGFVQWAILETATDTWLPSIGKFSLLLDRWGIESSATVRLVFLLYAASLVGMLVGWHTRAFAVAAWATHTLTVNSGYISLYGVDTMLHIVLFYFVWMPVGDAWSLDQRLGRTAARSSVASGLSLRVLQLHLCIVYLNTGLAKAMGEQWWSGEAIWRALMQPQFAQLDYSWLAHVPWLAAALGWGTIVLELGYPIAIWPRLTRPLWLGGVLLLHLGVGLLMGLWLFSLVMIFLNACAFGSPGGPGATHATPAPPAAR